LKKSPTNFEGGLEWVRGNKLYAMCGFMALYKLDFNFNFNLDYMYAFGIALIETSQRVCSR